MRLWTLHPKYLDSAGLVALWREALLARAVLRGSTAGYRHHPQLERFRAQPRPVASLNRYLDAVYDESRRRGFTFDPGKLGRFVSFVNAPDLPDPNISFGSERGQIRPESSEEPVVPGATIPVGAP